MGDRAVVGVHMGILAVCLLGLVTTIFGQRDQIARLDRVIAQQERVIRDASTHDSELRQSVKAGNRLRALIARKVGIHEAEIERILANDPLGQ